MDAFKYREIGSVLGSGLENVDNRMNAPRWLLAHPESPENALTERRLNDERLAPNLLSLSYVPHPAENANGLPTSDMELWLDNDIFGQLDPILVADLARRFPAQPYPSGQVLFEAGAPSDALYVLLSGAVRVFHRATDGRETVVKLLGAPSVFGDVEIISAISFLESVSTIGQTLIAQIPAPVYRVFLTEHPEAMWAQLQHASDKFCVAIHHQRRCFDTLEERIANVLLSYCEFFGVAKGNAIVIAHPLSQRDIAHSLAVVQRSVANVFARWSKSGIVSKHGSHFLVRRPEVLQELAGPLRHGISYRMGLSLERLGRSPREVHAFVELVKPAEPSIPRDIGAEMTIGARSPSEFILSDPAASELHCRIFRGPTGQRYWIADLESKTGTWVNQKRIRRAVLRHGDCIAIGESRLKFSLTSSSPCSSG